MPPPTYKKSCPRCGKGFLTHDNTMEFCNQNCSAKHEYYKMYPHKDASPTREGKCTCCGAHLNIKGRGFLMFCNEHCKRSYTNAENRKKTTAKSSNKPRKKGLSYEELNRRAEYKRVFEDESWLYKRNHNRI